MNASTSTRQATTFGRAISRRGTLRGIGGAAVAALAIGLPNRAGAHAQHGGASSLFAPASGDDPAALVEAYVAAVNAGDLEAILALYADDAFHIALPSPDGSAGVCVGKAQFRMWYEQSVANGDRVAIENGTLAITGNQATFGVRLSSEPWRKLGVESLHATAEIVVINGRIMTHVVLLTPDAVRQLQAALESEMDSAMGSVSNPLMTASQPGERWAAPPMQQHRGEPY